MKAIVYPRKFTARSMASFCRTRISRADHAMQEISSCYGDVDLAICAAADELREQLADLERLITFAEEEGIAP
ncbi:hypothetical protein [uncultured Cohaesibacter sp.]|uniref:hypothetical protein n=1 Tax=uncultured Cohaesibacter sp. TaxID=1002546 RepID=UPI0029C836D6|nr:hypothetical protein [uncultured Cohaesibacter sp.]